MLPTTERDDDGFTLVEVMITSLILAIILTAFVGLLDSQQRAGNRVNALVNGQEDVRIAITTVSRDIRAADPMLSQALLGDYRDQIDLTLYDPVTNQPSHVRWKLTAATRTLTRATVATNGTETVTFRINNVHNNDSLPVQPLFSYYNGSDEDLMNLPAGVSPTQPGEVVGCTMRVHVKIVADTNPGPQPFTDETDVELRNQLPGDPACT